MDKQALESFIEMCDDLVITEEAPVYKATESGLLDEDEQDDYGKSYQSKKKMERTIIERESELQQRRFYKCKNSEDYKKYVNHIENSITNLKNSLRTEENPSKRNLIQKKISVLEDWKTRGKSKIK